MPLWHLLTERFEECSDISKSSPFKFTKEESIMDSSFYMFVKVYFINTSFSPYILKLKYPFKIWQLLSPIVEGVFLVLVQKR
ncbi:hypothetical protein EMIT040CA3_120043 [Bacillus pseudomycoides]